MSELTSTKPYMIRAIHEWCVDNQLTPHLLVEVSAQTKVPMAYVKDGEIVLNLNYSATKDLQFTNEAVTFSARFSGVSNNLYVPISAVKGIFARENGQVMFFEVLPEDVNENKNNEIDFSGDKEKNISPEVKKTTLKLVK